MESPRDSEPVSARAETARLLTIPAFAESEGDKRPTVELKPATVTVTAPARPTPQPYRAIGAYSVKKRATSQSDVARSPHLPDCEIIEILDGGVKFRVGEHVLKLPTSDARALGEMLLRAAK